MTCGGVPSRLIPICVAQTASNVRQYVSEYNHAQGVGRSSHWLQAAFALSNRVGYQLDVDNVEVFLEEVRASSSKLSRPRTSIGVVRIDKIRLREAGPPLPIMPPPPHLIPKCDPVCKTCLERTSRRERKRNAVLTSVREYEI